MAMLSRHAGCVFFAVRDAPVPLCGSRQDARRCLRPALPVPLCGILAIPTGDVRAGFATILDGVNTP